MRYTYLGPSGTFTESALLSVPGVVGAERIPATSVPNALERLRVATWMRHGAIENSVGRRGERYS